MTTPIQNAPPKPTWPLYVLAGMAYIPVFGILLGAAGLTWGLLSKRPHAIRAGMIAAGGALLNIVGLFALAMFLNVGDENITSAAQRIAAQQDLTKIVEALEEFHEENGEYPASLTELQRGPTMFSTLYIFDRTASVFSPRVYEYELSRDGATYDVFSLGADGERFTEDDVRPVLSDSLAAEAGYRAENSDIETRD